MSAQHVQREYRTRSSIRTRAQSKSMNSRAEIGDSSSRNDVSKGPKKKKRHLVADEDQAHKDDSTNNIKRMKKLDGSFKSTSHVNDSNITSQSSRADKSQTKVASNSPSSKLKDSSFNIHSWIADRSKASKAFSKLKSPKKLSLTLESPIRRRKSDVLLDLSNAAENAQHNSSKNDTPVHSKITPVKKTRSKSATPSSKKQILRFPKSPKIVLKSFSKPKSPYKKTSSLSKLQFPETKRSSNTSKNTVSRINIIEAESDENSENDSTSIDNKTTNEMALKSLKNGFTLKEPVVVLQRLSINTIAKSLFPLLSPLATDRASSTPNSSRKSSEFKYKRSRKSSRKSSLGTPSKYDETPSKLQKIDRTVEVKNATKSPLKTLVFSTPRDKSKIGKRSDKYETITSRLRNTTQQETSIQLESEQEEVEDKDATYELAEPQTPNLRNELKAKQDKTNSKEITKRKSLKVRFRSNSLDKNCTHGFRLSSISDKKEQLETSDNTTIAAKQKSPTHGFHERLNSAGRRIGTPVAKSFTPSFQYRRRSKSVTDTGSVATPLLITPIKKPDRKNPVSKKVPNFTEIHKKIFAKSESIVDAKRRIEKKHLAFAITPNKLVNKSAIVRNKENSKKEKLLSNESNKDLLYNRFGFKIRKNDATDCILKKCNLGTLRNKDREQGRTILKGVRTNRRFELLMKARNLNH